jgi:Transposase DDE domain
LLRLVFVHAGADLGLRQTVTLVAEGGGPDVSHVTLHKKMRLSSFYLQALVGRLTALSAESDRARWAGYELLIVDGSSFCRPGASGTDARIHAQIRLADLQVVHAIVEDRSVGESFKRFPWQQGQLALGDRGYANPPGIASVVEQGGDVLVRVNRTALPMYGSNGQRVDLMAWLRSLKGYMPRERAVTVVSGDTEVHGRLIAVRLPETQAHKALAWVRRELGNKASETDLEAAHYVVLFTTVRVERMTTAMCLELYRLRWQVELTFKRWKSLCHFDKVPNTTAAPSLEATVVCGDVGRWGTSGAIARGSGRSPVGT